MLSYFIYSFFLFFLISFHFILFYPHATYSSTAGGGMHRKIVVSTRREKKKKTKKEKRHFRFVPGGGGRFQHGGAAETEPVHGQCSRTWLPKLRFLHAGETGHHFQGVRP